MSDLSSLSGLFVGQLSDEEMAAFDCAVDEGRAYRDFSGVAGLLGLAKVKIIRPVAEDDERDFKLHQHDFL